MSRVFVFTQILDGKSDGSRKWARVFWVALLATLVLASVVPASASESSGVAAWGLNTDGQLGNGTTTTEKEAVAVKVLAEATAVAGGELHSLALLKTGKVMAWGLNTDGQLGNNTTTTEKEPVEVKKITEAVAIAAGADHSLALLKTGKVMAWGENSDGQLGNGTTTNGKEPVEVKGITEAVAIAAGSDDSLAVLKNGKVMAWGDNNDGQLGNNTTTNEKEPVEVKKITEATTVVGGEFHSVALLANGKVMAWGENNDGQLGNGTSTTEKEPVEVKGLSGAVGGISAGANFGLASYATKPTNTTLPAVSGEAKDEKALTVSTGTWSGSPTIIYSYQWESCNTSGESCSNISGAAASSYTIAHEQVGHTIRVKVTAKNSANEATATSAATATVAAAAPTNTTLPAVSGEAKDEKALTVSTGTWSGSPTITYSYQWESCNTSGESCTNISGATSSSYTIAHEQVGHTVRVKVTAQNSVGEATVSSAQTATVAGAPPTNEEKPEISGSVKVGQLLTVSNGTWSGTPATKYAYQWESCVSKTCKAITGATESSYRVIGSQLGDTLQAVVTDENPAGKASGTSAETVTITAGPPVNTAPPAISGTAKEGETLSASTGSWAGTEPFSYTYQWRSCNSSGESCFSISGATNATYKLPFTSVGRALRVVVTAKNSATSTEEESIASTVVLEAAPSDTSPPAISGTIESGQLLTVSKGDWEGTSTLSYAYQWEKCNSTGESCSSISGATAPSYRVLNSQIGSTLRVIVTVSNSAGSEKVTTAATTTITAGPPANAALPIISGKV